MSTWSIVVSFVAGAIVSWVPFAIHEYRTSREAKADRQRQTIDELQTAIYTLTSASTQIGMIIDQLDKTPMLLQVGRFLLIRAQFKELSRDLLKLGIDIKRLSSRMYNQSLDEHIDKLLDAVFPAYLERHSRKREQAIATYNKEFTATKKLIEDLLKDYP